MLARCGAQIDHFGLVVFGSVASCPGWGGSRGAMMQADQRVYLKSDKAGRSLALAFCLAPVLVPALTIGTVFALREWPSVDFALPAALTSSAQAAAPLIMEPVTSATLGALPARHVFSTSVFDDPVQPPPRFEPSGQSFVAQSPAPVEGELETEAFQLRPSR